MAVSSKHLATFLLGALAGAALHKYAQTEEGQKAMADLKDKANNLKDEASKAMDNAPEYFENLKEKGLEALKTNFPEVEKTLSELFKGKATEGATEAEPKA